MRVLFLGSYPSGPHDVKGVFNRRAAQSLSDYVKVSVVSYLTWRPGRKFFRRWNDGHVEVYSFCIPHLPSVSGRGYLVWLRFIERYIGFRISNVLKASNVVHSVGLIPNGIVGGWLSRRHALPHVCQLTGSDVNSWMPRLLARRPAFDVCGLLDGVGANSTALASEFTRLFGRKIDVNVIYRGVSLTEFPYSPHRTEEEMEYLYLGGLPGYRGLSSGSNAKGGVTLTKAWSLGEQFFYRCRARLLFAGPGSDSGFARDWKSKLEYPGQVELLGEVSLGRVKDLYQRCSVVLVPSLEEGLPNVAMEAASVGRCVIGSRIGGVPEVVQDCATGFLVPPGNEQALSDAMQVMAVDARRFVEMGLEAHRFVTKKFDHTNFARGYLDLYEIAKINQGKSK